ncbi:MAG: YbjQ family protein [Candidatus Caenarcaniphilales bacterium]|nr:YbjQ family protein [Candidatus Caenarcaniphilales bacterium]
MFTGSKMILTTIDHIPGAEIGEHYGMVTGSTVRAKHVFTDFMSGLKNIFGGEMGGYTALLEETRQQSIDRMVQQAEKLGANAVLNIRFATSDIAQGAAEIYVYGTAVKVR